MEWHVELWETTWVFWGYGPVGGVEHVQPARVVVNVPRVPAMSFDFELPEHRDGSSLPPPQEYRRVRGVGWRVRHNDLVHDCGWRFASDESAARAAAAAWLKKNPEIAASASKDVRVRAVL